LPPKSAKSHEILLKFELIALQDHPIKGHRSWCQSKANMQLLVINSNYVPAVPPAPCLVTSTRSFLWPLHSALPALPSR